MQQSLTWGCMWIWVFGCLGHRKVGGRTILLTMQFDQFNFALSRRVNYCFEKNWAKITNQHWDSTAWTFYMLVGVVFSGWLDMSKDAWKAKSVATLGDSCANTCTQTNRTLRLLQWLLRIQWDNFFYKLHRLPVNRFRWTREGVRFAAHFGRRRSAQEEHMVGRRMQEEHSSFSLASGRCSILCCTLILLVFMSMVASVIVFVRSLGRRFSRLRGRRRCRKIEVKF